jgi:hypothetical protein
MSDTLCPLPHRHEPDRPRRAIDGGYLCSGHLAGLTRDITTAPELYDALAQQLATVGSGGEPVSGSRDPGMALNEAAADARATLRAVLASWARVVVEDRGINPPGRSAPEALPLGFIGPPRLEWVADDSPLVVARWLATHVDWLACQPFADEVCAEIRDATSRAWSIAYPSGRRRYEVGPCPLECDGTLWASLARVDDLLPSRLRCSADPEHEWGADQWLTLGRRLRGKASA